MKKLIYISIGLVALGISLFSLSPHAHAAFGFSRTITIDHAKVSSSGTETYTNYPMLVSSTISTLATTGNGGNVQNANGYDIGFYTSSDCATGKMKWEMESSTYNATNGTVYFWVNQASVSTSSDTVFYLCYGDDSVSTDQSTSTTWNSNYKGVWHVSNGTTLFRGDSTKISGTLAINGTVTTSTGQIDGGTTFGGTQSDNLTVDDSNLPNGASPITFEAWIDPLAFNASEGYIVYGSNADTNIYILGHNGSGLGFTTFNVGAFYAGTFNTGTWYHVVGNYDGTNLNLYLNGSLVAGPTAYGMNIIRTGTLTIGSWPFGSWLSENKMDEIRVSSGTLSADWIKTEYNNQSNPGTFYQVGNEVSLTASAVIYVSNITIAKSTTIRSSVTIQ